MKQHLLTHDTWNHVSGYLVYIASAFVALFVEAIVGALSYIVPSMQQGNLKDNITEGTSDVMKTEEFVIRVIDGHLFVWDITMVEIMQLAVLTITFIVTAIKMYIDIHRILRQKKFDRRRGETISLNRASKKKRSLNK